jgi:hypothetical protein
MAGLVPAIHVFALAGRKKLLGVIPDAAIGLSAPK